MKKYVKTYKLIAVFLLLINILLLIILTYEKTKIFEMSKFNQQSNDSIIDLKGKNKILHQDIALMLEFQFRTIDSNVILYDENNIKTSLKQLCNKKPKLIFKYSTLNCNVCVDEQIKLLKKETEIIGVENVIIITDYKTTRELYQFRRMNQIDIKIYNLMNYEITRIDKNLPYYFVLNSNSSISQLFIPIKNENVFIFQYFKEINNRYFQNNSKI